MSRFVLHKIRWFLLLTGILVVIVVAFQNGDPVDLKLLFFSGTYPLTLLLLATAAISFVLGGLMTAWTLRAQRKRREERAKGKRSVPSKTNPPETETSPRPGANPPTA